MYNEEFGELKYNPSIDTGVEEVQESEVDGTSIANLLKNREEPQQIKELAKNVNGSLTDMNKNNLDIDLSENSNQVIDIEKTNTDTSNTDTTNTTKIIKYIGEMILFVMIYITLSQENTINILSKYMPNNKNILFTVYGILLYVFFTVLKEIFQKIGVF